VPAIGQEGRCDEKLDPVSGIDKPDQPFNLWMAGRQALMKPQGCLPVIFVFFLVVLLPFVFAQVFLTAMAKLHLTPEVGLLVVMGIFLGSVINIPIKKVMREEEFVVDPFSTFGLSGLWPRFQRVQRETIIAINVGGCLIPTSLAVYEMGHLLTSNLTSLLVVVLAVSINVGVCYWMAKPVEGIGIALPAFIPPLTAVSAALLLAPDEAPAVAFVAGVMGPLLGADLLHLRDISRIATGMGSIGGAGTFDGIVLSGILAAYLA